MKYANEPKFFWLGQFFMTKNKMSKKGFKTSWLLKKSQNMAPG